MPPVPARPPVAAAAVGLAVAASVGLAVPAAVDVALAAAVDLALAPGRCAPVSDKAYLDAVSLSRKAYFKLSLYGGGRLRA